MFAVGLAGQPRRVADPAAMFATGNLVSTIGAYVIGVGMLIFLYAILHSWRRGEVAPANPWGAKTLEWQVPTPVPLENFTVLPVVTSDFYGYSENGSRAPEPAPGRPVRRWLPRSGAGPGWSGGGWQRERRPASRLAGTCSCGARPMTAEARSSIARPRQRRGGREDASGSGSCCSSWGTSRFVLSLVFTYLYLRALNTEGGWIPARGGHTVPIGSAGSSPPSWW